MKLALKIRFYYRKILCLLFSSPLPPEITKFSLVDLDPIDLKRQADSGGTIQILLSKRRVQIAIEPSTVLADDCEVFVVSKEGIEKEKFDPQIAYKGKVVGDDSSIVRLTITPSWITGYVIQGPQWWFIEPLSDYTPNAKISEHIVYRSRDVLFRLKFGDDAIKYGPTGPVFPTSGDLPVVPVVREINLAMVSDAEYRYDYYREITGIDRGDREWRYSQIALINGVNGIFEPQINLSFRIRGHFQFDLLDHPLTSTDTEELLNQLEEAWTHAFGNLRLLERRRGMGIEIAHLTTGKRLDNDKYGIASEPGVYSLSRQPVGAIFRGEGGFGGGGAFPGLITAVHELGHNLNAVHEEADEVCVTHFIICLDYERSLMWRQPEEDTQPRFSRGNHNPSHDNYRRISFHVGSDARERDF